MKCYNLFTFLLTGVKPFPSDLSDLSDFTEAIDDLVDPPSCFGLAARSSSEWSDRGLVLDRSDFLDLSDFSERSGFLDRSDLLDRSDFMDVSDLIDRSDFGLFTESSE